MGKASRDAVRVLAANARLLGVLLGCAVGLLLPRVMKDKAVEVVQLSVCVPE